MPSNASPFKTYELTGADGAVRRLQGSDIKAILTVDSIIGGNPEPVKIELVSE